MKPVLLLSDFDGTISLTDFYLRYAKGPLKELDEQCIKAIRAGTMSSYEYLNAILKAVNHTKEELMEHIHALPIDSAFKPLVEKIEESGGEVVIASAGSSCYIKPILERLGLSHLKLYANGGGFVPGGIEMTMHPLSELHCDFYGINKAAVLKKISSEYETVIYAGDGSSDAEAARLADIRFAKASLARRLTQSNTEFFPFETYQDITNKLDEIFF